MNGKLFSFGGLCRIAILFGASTLPAAAADSVPDFYKSKNLTLIVASGVGGGYDLYGRNLARHLGKHIPGNPSVVVQNMEGAAGLKGINYLANVAPKDGSVIQATYGNLTIRPLIDPRGAEYDPLTLRWIGSSGTQISTCATWHTSPIKTIDQAKTREIPAAATGADGSLAIMPNILNRLVGTKFKIITGYTSGGLRIAMESGESESLCGLAYTVLVASNPDWFTGNKLTFLTQFGSKKIPQLPNVPLATDFITDTKDKPIFDLLGITQRMGQPYVAPPGVPEDRLAVLRKAFDDTMKDPEFLAESSKLRQEVDPMTGREMESFIKSAYALPKEIVSRYAALTTDIQAEEKKK